MIVQTEAVAKFIALCQEQGWNDSKILDALMDFCVGEPAKEQHDNVSALRDGLIGEYRERATERALRRALPSVFWEGGEDAVRLPADPSKSPRARGDRAGQETRTAA